MGGMEPWELRESCGRETTCIYDMAGDVNRDHGLHVRHNCKHTRGDVSCSCSSLASQGFYFGGYTVVVNGPSYNVVGECV